MSQQIQLLTRIVGVFLVLSAGVCGASVSFAVNTPLGVYSPIACELALVPYPIGVDALAHAPEIVLVTHQDDDLQMVTANVLAQNPRFVRLPKLVLASEVFGISAMALHLQANRIGYSRDGEINTPLRPVVVHALGGNVRWCLKRSLSDIVDDFMADPDRPRLEINLYQHLSYQGSETFDVLLARQPEHELSFSEFGNPGYFVSYFHNRPSEFDLMWDAKKVNGAVRIRMELQHWATGKIVVFNVI